LRAIPAAFFTVIGRYYWPTAIFLSFLSALITPGQVLLMTAVLLLLLLLLGFMLPAHCCCCGGCD
jgi:hypothetical protein